MKRLAVASVVLFALRLWAASAVGFGDSEALYVSWAAHPQPAYLDHPGLVGLFARLVAGGTPSPFYVHVVTSVIATLVPWLALATARVLGATRERAEVAGLAVALVPETAVGLFALTPDLLLAPAWLGAIALAVGGLRGEPGSTRSAGALLGAGLLAGIAASTKVSGVLLLFALALAYVVVARSRRAADRDHARIARGIWPWAGLLAGVVVLLPIIAYETHLDFPMLRHRLVDSQAGAGLALRNVGALVGGQLLYVSPLFAWIAVRVARDLVRRRSEDVATWTLFAVFALPLVPLVALCLWSAVAEPHWIAPALLALPLAAALAPGSLPSRKVMVAAFATAGAFTLVAHLWVLTPLSSMLAGNDPRDISSELYGWPKVTAEAREQLRLAATPFDPEGHDAALVGPHWTICAQLQANLPDVRVGCATPIKDDFDRWYPRDEWRKADHVLWVTDARFPGDGAEQLPRHVKVAEKTVEVRRGGRVARTFVLSLYSRRGAG